MTPGIPQKRLVSLDAFRGATIAGMMLVNNPGTWSAVYPQLLHASWNGWTFTDWIFPFFLWIVGVAMTFSFAKRVEQGGKKGELTLHVLQRSAVILKQISAGLVKVIFGTGFPSPSRNSTLTTNGRAHLLSPEAVNRLGSRGKMARFPGTLIAPAGR